MNFTEETITAINKSIILGIVSELTVLEIEGNAFQDLKARLNRLAAAGKSVQSYFQVHPNTSPQLRETFRREFLGGKHVLISEILTLLTNMSEDGCESVLNAIKEAIERENAEQVTPGALHG